MEKEFKTNWVENIVCIALGRIMITPYNWSLILVAILLWSFGNLFPYSSNANFDMTVAVNEYSKYMSIFSVAVGFYLSGRKANILIGLGIANYLLSLITIIMSKTIFLNGLIGVFLLKPVSIFCLLLILKHMWILSVDRASNDAAG